MTQLLQTHRNTQEAAVSYSSKENAMWYTLYTQQLHSLKYRAHEYFFELLDMLCLPQDRVPQLSEVSNILFEKSGWSLARVDGLIPYNDFFTLLANKIFPSTIYIRKSKNFSKDPDIFHELFGHCPMLLDTNYSNFITTLATFALQRSELERVMLQRLLWFTIEVGLIHTDDGYRVYGGALLSSPEEAIYALESNNAERKHFNLLDVFRSPYRADYLQKTYFCINDMSDLYNVDLSDEAFSTVVKQAIQLGEYPAKFSVEYNKYSSVHCF